MMTILQVRRALDWAKSEAERRPPRHGPTSVRSDAAGIAIDGGGLERWPAVAASPKFCLLLKIVKDRNEPEPVDGAPDAPALHAGEHPAAPRRRRLSTPADDATTLDLLGRRVHPDVR